MPRGSGVDVRDGDDRELFYWRRRREPSALRSIRVLGPAASFDGRRSVVVTAARGQVSGFFPDQGWTVFHLPSTLGGRACRRMGN